jgi:hypothetical protein
MSIFWVIFVIFLFFTGSPSENELDDVFKKWKADDRANDGSNSSDCPHEICRQAEEIHRFNLDDLG